MSNDTVMAFPDPSASVPVIYDPDVCTGCNKCVNVCQVDLLIPNPEKNGPPWYFTPGMLLLRLLRGRLSGTRRHQADGPPHAPGAVEAQTNRGTLSIGILARVEEDSGKITTSRVFAELFIKPAHKGEIILKERWVEKTDVGTMGS